MHCPACGTLMRQIDLRDRVDDPDSERASYSFNFICPVDSSLTGFVSDITGLKGKRLVSFIPDIGL